MGGLKINQLMSTKTWECSRSAATVIKTLHSFSLTVSFSVSPFKLICINANHPIIHKNLHEYTVNTKCMYTIKLNIKNVLVVYCKDETSLIFKKKKKTFDKNMFFWFLIK